MPVSEEEHRTSTDVDRVAVCFLTTELQFINNTTVAVINGRNRPKITAGSRPNFWDLAIPQRLYLSLL